jgi:pyruvate kinase
MKIHTYTPRERKVRILATIGPASSTPEMIEKLYAAGADAFRLNMSHGTHENHAARLGHIRELEAKTGRPMTILADLQGPKLRVGKFAAGQVMLETGADFILDMDTKLGDETRVCLPHPEIHAAMKTGARLLLDDGKLVLRVVDVTADHVRTRVEVGGILSDNKGLNVPDVVVPLAALTVKDHEDLRFALEMGVDWVALSFVQRPEDLIEARKIVNGRVLLLAKIEKPQALERLEEILEQADAVMVARGDLGVELPPQAVPIAQKRIVEAARRLGKPVVVATQMLESMIKSPSPTRAEVSDVANAIYDGADAVMLSAESASGDWPVESVHMMHEIAVAVENGAGYKERLHFTETLPDMTVADALSQASANIAETVAAKAIMVFTSSGSSARRIARERPSVPLLVMTNKLATARRLGLLWGVHAVHTRDVTSFEHMVAKAKRMALRHHFAMGGERVVVIAGVPFGTPGSTNMLHVVKIVGDELD